MLATKTRDEAFTETVIYAMNRKKCLLYRNMIADWGELGIVLIEWNGGRWTGRWFDREDIWNPTV